MDIYFYLQSVVLKSTQSLVNLSHRTEPPMAAQPTELPMEPRMEAMDTVSS